ncbi:hypothetical protein Tco_1337079 [Tanacetum coccineum]
MNQERIQQAAHDEAWVPKADKIKISTTNMRIDPTMPQKEKTYQVILDIIKNSTCYNAFLITTDVPEIYMQQFWYKVRKIKKTTTYEFDLADKKCKVDVEDSTCLEEETTEIMTKTTEQYMSKTRGNYGSGVVRPKINDKTHFELKGKYLKELRENTFSGSEHEDANEHIKKVLEIVDLFPIPELNNLGREIKKVNEKVYAAQVGFELCKGSHYTKDCSLKEEGNTLEEAYYTQLGAPYQPTGLQTLEESLTKFLAESAKRHDENSNIIKEIRASTDAAIRNQGASIKTFEIQIGQIYKVLHERGIGGLPGSTEPNPRDHIKSISIAKANSSEIRRMGCYPYAVSGSQHRSMFS